MFVDARFRGRRCILACIVICASACSRKAEPPSAILQPPSVETKAAIPAKSAASERPKSVARNELADQAELLADEGEFDAALATYDKAIGLSPTDGRLRRPRIRLLNRMKRHQEALAEIKYCLDNNLGRKEFVVLDLSYTYQCLGEPERAIDALSKAIAESTDDLQSFTSKLGLLYDHRGDVYGSVGKYKEALADYQKAGVASPESVTISQKGFWTAVKVQDFDAAIVIADRAIAINQYDPEFHACRALIFAASPDAKHRDAKKALDTARWAEQLRESKDLPIVDVALAAAYAANGDFASAVEHQERAIKAAADDVSERMLEQLKRYKSRQPFTFSKSEGHVF